MFTLEKANILLRVKSLTELLTEVINGDQGTRGRQVLIVDKLSTRLVSSCLQMHDLCEGGVTRKL